MVSFTTEKKDNEKIRVRNEKLIDLKVFNEPAGRYYTVAYINEETKQIVFTYHGTIEIWDLSKTSSSLKIHFKSILGRQIVTQQAMGYIVTKKITK